MLNSNLPNRIQSTRFEYNPWIRTRDGPPLPSAGFQIGNLSSITVTKLIIKKLSVISIFIIEESHRETILNSIFTS